MKKHRMVNDINNMVKSPVAIPVFLLVVSVLAYGLLIPSLGFYWDDLPYALIHHRFGPGGYPAFVSSDRPHSAWIFIGLTFLLGEQPIGYHLFGLVLYWLCAVLFWRFLRLVWPQYEKEAFWAALLFTIYPGFLGQPKTIIYNHHFAAMALYLFSLIGTVNAVQAIKNGTRRGFAWLWHLSAVLATALSQFTIEYYIGWEAVRLVAVWMCLSRQTGERKQKIRESIPHLIPYWLVTLGFLIWRVLIFQFPTYQPLGGEGANFASLGWWQSIISQIVEATFVVWRYALPLLSSQDYSQTFWLAYLILILVSSVLIFVVLQVQNKALRNADQQKEQQPKWDFSQPALLMAFAGIAFAGWPFWLVNLRLSIVGHFYSRFTLAFIPWVALLMAALFHMLSKIKAQWINVALSGLMALLVGGSIGWHFWNANFYRNQWVDVQRYFQQLVHRAPGLEHGTILLINDLQSLSLYQDDSLTALLNWTYAPDNKTQDLDFAVFYLSVRLGTDLPALEAGLPIEKDFRSLRFNSSTDNILVVFNEPPGCLRILNPNRPDRNPLDLPEALLEALPLSNLDTIRTDNQPGAFFPAHLNTLDDTESWCLFFQEAELAAQRSDWAQVAQIGQLAYAGEDQANELTENFVFIDGFLRAGQTETAFVISQDLSKHTDGKMVGRICGIWRGAGVSTGSYYEQLCVGKE